MEIVGEVAREDAWPIREDARDVADFNRVGGGPVDHAVDVGSGSAVNSRDKGGGFPFVFPLCFFGPKDIDDQGVHRLKPSRVEGLAFGDPGDEPPNGFRGGFVNA